MPILATLMHQLSARPRARRLASTGFFLALVTSALAARAGPGGGKCPEGMAALPSGSFKMGQRGDTVTVSQFCLDISPVTVEAYAACVRSGKCTPAVTSSGCNAEAKNRGNHPINCVNWAQAAAYCANAAKELPTEEQWEWAARGGAAGTTYPWGEAAPKAQVCWNGEGNDMGKGKRTSTCPVGSYPKGDSPEGIHDLAGNVWEWTATVYSVDDTPRVYRGGSWGVDTPDLLRADTRFRVVPTFVYEYLGFRCAKAAK
jgi:formylglycine-generating enzyme required for sulfatase activity